MILQKLEKENMFLYIIVRFRDKIIRDINEMKMKLFK